MYVCFRFFSQYHNAVSTRVTELASEDLEANEIVSLLTWVLNTYKRYSDKLLWDIHHFKDRTFLVPSAQVKFLRLSYAVSGDLGFAFVVSCGETVAVQINLLNFDSASVFLIISKSSQSRLNNPVVLQTGT